MSPRSGPRSEGGPDRPAVSVIVPFAGGADEARATLAGLGRLRLRPGDEVIVADNTPDGVVAAVALDDGPAVVAATAERSSYHARNAGAERARNEWLLFMDADCRPDPGLLDAYFEPPPSPGTVLVAGAVAGASGQDGPLPRWARSRNQLSEEHLVTAEGGRPHPATGTGNMLLRRSAWEALGGFHEGVRSGADVELCWRVGDAGWGFERRPGARVEHEYGTSVMRLARQAARHAAGRRWVNRRYPGAFPRPRPLAELGRCAVGAVGWTLLLQPVRGLHKLIDAVSLGGSAWGWWLGRNRVSRDEPPVQARSDRSLVVVTDAFPARSETFVYNEALTLREQGWALRVESLARPARVERAVARSLRVDYFEDDAPLEKLRDLAWLVARHPLRSLRDRRDSRRWSAEEEVWPLAALAPATRRLARGGERRLHAHFAAGGALQAMRLSRLLGVPWGLTAHAYDIFQRPRNLPEKLRRARFAAAECEYAADALRELAPDAAERVHRIATGTDGSRFRRTRPAPGSGRVVAIGRLVEKKGFPHLIRAAALLRESGGASEVTIAGEGPLGDELRALVAELGLEDYVRMLGPLWGPGAVRELLEGADLLAVPSVIAADGDRDALPLVAYEALAMEVPVVASDLVGLPELVRPPWGRLAPPADHEALARAIAELLALPAAERADAARQGREFVLERFDPVREARRLGELIAAA